MCSEFGIDVDFSLPKFNAVSKLRDFFIDSHAEGRQCVIMVDEAQSIPVITLEEIRLLLNLETETSKLVQVLLFGQPELDVVLQNPEIRQIESRIAQSFYLEPFTSDDVFKYLNFRMSIAGYHGDYVFNKRVSNLIAKRSKGIVRNIHYLADSALMAGYADSSSKLKTKHVTGRTEIKNYSYFSPAFASILVVSFLVYGLFFSGMTVTTPVFSNTSEVTESDGFIPKDVSDNSSPQFETEFAPNDIDLESTGVKSDLEKNNSEVAVISSKLISRVDNIEYLHKLRSALLGRDGANFTLQVIAGNVLDMERVINDLYQVIGSDDIFWLIDGTRYVMYVGYFSGFSEARMFINLLPSHYTVGNPFVIDVKHVVNRIDAVISSLEAS
jgi:hypothetical protein